MTGTDRREPIDPKPPRKVEEGTPRPTLATGGATRPGEGDGVDATALPEDDVDETMAGGLHYPDEEEGDER